MILVDANLLLYAKFSSFPQHQKARRWLDERLSRRERVGIPVLVWLAYLRLSTNARLFTEPLSADQALKDVESWFSTRCAWEPQPTDSHRAVFAELVRATEATGNLIMDAHLGALAIEHGLVIMTADTDFARFPDVKWHNPLQDKR